MFCLTTSFLNFPLSSKFDIKGLSNLVEDNFLERKSTLQPEYVFSIWYSQYLLPSQHWNLQEAYSKVVFWKAMVLVLHIYSYFYWRIKYSKFISGDVHGTSMEPSCHTGVQIMGLSRAFRRTSIKQVFKTTLKHVELTLTG